MKQRIIGGLLAVLLATGTAIGLTSNSQSKESAEAQSTDISTPPVIETTTTTLPEGKIIVNGEIQDHPAFKNGCWDSTGVPNEPGGNHGLGECLAKSVYGWDGKQFECLSKLWGKYESGWSQHADNPDSSAHGIPQALPGKKMGDGWRYDVRVQIMWGLKYVKETKRYGTPCKALDYRLRNGGY